MSEFDLKKKSAAIDAILTKKGVTTAPTMRVGAALDISGSMENIISSGKLQMALNQLMGAAMRFDDNGELDVFKFDTSCEYVGTCKPGSYENYVANNNIRTRGGTAYSPIITAAQEFFFGAKAEKKGFFGFGKKDPAPGGGGNVDNTPVLMLIITDGECNDRAEIEAVLKNSGNDRIYYHFVGVGGSRNNFPTIAKLADKFDNVGEVYLPRFDMADDDVYAQLISDELVQFVGKL